MTTPHPDSPEDHVVENTDIELWRKPGASPGMEYYQPSIHVTQDNRIGIDVGGRVIVMSVEKWHELATQDTEYYTNKFLEIVEEADETINDRAYEYTVSKDELVKELKEAIKQLSKGKDNE